MDLKSLNFLVEDVMSIDTLPNTANIQDGLRMLMNDDVFSSQVKSIFLGFKKNRFQITPHQESILKSVPKRIEVLEKLIKKLSIYVTNPSNVKKSDFGDNSMKLSNAKETLAMANELLDETISQIDELITNNEDLNSQYLDQLSLIIKHSGRRISEQYPSLSQNIDKFVGVHDDGEGESSDIEKYISSLSEEYDKIKQILSETGNNINFRHKVENLYYNLPMYSLNDKFFKILKKNPYKISKVNSNEPLDVRLGYVRNEEQFNILVPEIQEYIETTKIGKDKANKIKDILSGPFITRKGSPNSAIKIKRLMKTTITEKFDNLYDKLIKENTLFDEDDLKIDIMEVAYLIEKNSKDESKKSE